MIRAADVRILAGAPATLSYQFGDADGEPAAPTDSVTIGIASVSGTTIVAALTATSGTGSSPRTYSLAASASTQPDLWTASWRDGNGTTHTQMIEIVGGYYFTLAEFYNWAGDLGDVSDAEVILARRVAEETCEALTGISFVPRYRRVALDGSGTERQRLPDPVLRKVRAVTITYSGSSSSSWTASQIASVSTIYSDGHGEAAEAGIAVRRDFGPWLNGSQNIVIDYEHGYDRPPQDIKQAVMRHTRAVLRESIAPSIDSSSRWQTPDGTLIFKAIPARDRVGIPDIDSTYQRYSILVPGMA